MALTQADILRISEPVEEMYMNCTSQLIINIAEHFKTGKGLATQAWQAQKLSEMGQLTDEAIEIIAANTGQKADVIRRSLTEAVTLHLGDEEKMLQAAAKKGLAGPNIGTLETSRQVQAVVKAYADQATDQLNLVNTVMLQSTQNRYMLAVQQVVAEEERFKIEALTSAKNATELAQQMGKVQKTLNTSTGSVVLGAESRQKAVRDAIKTLADEGITGFIDAGGHHWTPEAYVNMDIRTTVGNTARQAQRARSEEYGIDTFQVSSHAAARPLCAPYQGWICSWSGGGYTVEDGRGREYLVHDINETSYGEPAGLFGINCGHNPITFVPGYSLPRYQELTPEQEKQNKIQYAESQQQRYLEREVRQSKTEALAYQAAGDKEGFEKAAQAVKQKTADYANFCDATGRTPRPDRMQVAGYNRSTAAKANAAARGYTPVQKVTPNVPEVPQAQKVVIPPFSPAKDKASAEEYAMRFAEKVNYKGVNLQKANEINEALNELTAKYPIKKLYTIKPTSGKAIASATHVTLNIHGSKIGATTSTWAENLKGKQAVIDTLKSRYVDKEKLPPDIERAIKNLKYDFNFSRWAVMIDETGATDIKYTIAHEYGHILSDQYFGLINYSRANKNAYSPELSSLRALVKDTYKKAQENGDIFKISRYGATNMDEFFAETFAMREKGEQLPDYIENMLKETLKNGGTMQ